MECSVTKIQNPRPDATNCQSHTDTEEFISESLRNTMSGLSELANRVGLAQSVARPPLAR